MPELEIRPLPFPALRTSNDTLIVAGWPGEESLSKLTPTHCGSSFIVAVHEAPSGTHPNSQRCRLCPEAGETWRVTVECAGKGASQLGGQSIPAGLLVT